MGIYEIGLLFNHPTPIPSYSYYLIEPSYFHTRTLLFNNHTIMLRLSNSTMLSSFSYFLFNYYTVILVLSCSTIIPSYPYTAILVLTYSTTINTVPSYSRTLLFGKSTHMSSYWHRTTINHTHTLVFTIMPSILLLPILYPIQPSELRAKPHHIDHPTIHAHCGGALFKYSSVFFTSEWNINNYFL